MPSPGSDPPLPLSLLAAAALLLLILLLSRTAALAASRLPTLSGKRIVLLIAHPDDEAMFFAPTVLGLTRPERGNHVKILCLSAGDAAGLGETRKRELVKSGLALGLKAEDDVFVVDTPDFPDSMTTTWDARKISALLCSAFAPQTDPPSSRPSETDSTHSSAAAPAAPAAANIDVLITFDGRGVSAHPNHISLYHGARAFQAALAGRLAGAGQASQAGEGLKRPRSPVDLYTLRTVGLLRKYSGWADVLTTLALQDRSQARRGNTHEHEKKSENKSNNENENENRNRNKSEVGGKGDDDDSKNRRDEEPPRSLVFTTRILGEGPLLSTAWAAMTTAHRSQMVWFRYLWLGFSRYMLVNDLLLEEEEAAAEGE